MTPPHPLCSKRRLKIQGVIIYWFLFYFLGKNGTAAQLSFLLSGSRMRSASKDKIKPRRQEARQISASRLQTQGRSWTGLRTAGYPQDPKWPSPAWRGRGLGEDRSEPVATPTRGDHVVTTKTSWWGLAACWERAKCRTSVTASTNS